MTTFANCNDASKMAADIIEAHHEHLAQAEIVYLLTDGTKSKAILANPLQRYLTSGDAEDVEVGADWILLIEQGEWNGLTEPGRAALLDELLAQCGQEEDERTQAKRWVRRRGVTVWPEVLQRRGFWRSEYSDIKSAASVQLSMELTPAGSS